MMLQELIGHCTAVYLNNRQTALALEQHLSQYGYQQAPGTEVEPEHLDTLIVADDGKLTCCRCHTAPLSNQQQITIQLQVVPASGCWTLLCRPKQHRMYHQHQHRVVDTQPVCLDNFATPRVPTALLSSMCRIQH